MMSRLQGQVLDKQPSKKSLRLFNMTSEARDGPTATDFRVQLGGSSRMSRWNKRAADVFAAEFSRLLPYKKSVIKAAFFTHLITLRAKYKEKRHPTSPAAAKKECRQSAAEARKRRVGRVISSRQYLILTNIPSTSCFLVGRRREAAYLLVIQSFNA